MAQDVEKGGLSLGAWLVLLVWPILVAAGALRWSGALHVGAELAQRPRVAVVDVRAAVDAHMAAHGGSDASLAAATAHVQGIARRLRNAGYVVLDASYVYAYPPEFEAETVPAAPAAKGVTP